MQHLWTLTCDFCGKTIDRQKDIPKDKKYTLHNISFKIQDHDTATQGAKDLIDVDLCNTCALKFITYLRENAKDWEQKCKSDILKQYHEHDPKDNNSFYRHENTEYESTWLFTTLEDYKKEPAE